MNSPGQTPNPNQTPRRRPSPFNRRAPGEPARDGGLWNSLGGEPRLLWSLGLVVIWILVSGALWLVNHLSWPFYFLVRALDVATGAAALPAAPFLVWAIWGAIWGGLLGHWLLAPLYGQRESRSLPLYLAGLAMMLSAVLMWAFVR